jgi:hypothetical protein
VKLAPTRPCLPTSLSFPHPHHIPSPLSLERCPALITLDVVPIGRVITTLPSLPLTCHHRCASLPPPALPLRPPNSNAEMSPSNTHPQKSNLHRGAAGVGGDAASSYPSANAHNKRIECGEEERLGYSLPIPNFFTRIHQTGIALAASNFLVDRIKASMV